MCFTSSAESSFLTWPPVQSIVSTRKTSPSAIVTTAGISGCQRLWSGVSCSHGIFLMSTEIAVFGMASEVL